MSHIPMRIIHRKRDFDGEYWQCRTGRSTSECSSLYYKPLAAHTILIDAEDGSVKIFSMDSQESAAVKNEN